MEVVLEVVLFIMIVIGTVAGGWLFLILGGWPAVIIYEALLAIAVYLYLVREDYYAAVGGGK